MADKRNAPVDHHNGIFMIREKKKLNEYILITQALIVLLYQKLF